MNPDQQAPPSADIPVETSLPPQPYVAPAPAPLPPQNPPAIPAGQVPLQTPGAEFVPQGALPAGSAAPTPKQANRKTTQNTLLIAEIRDGIVIMQDGSYRAVMLAQSINFDLMSPQEREGVESAFQGFLNSLYFPVQITLRSRRIDLRGYLTKLDKIRSEHDNVLLGLLMDDYMAYIQYLAQSANIMDKQFYVVLPYYTSTTEALLNKASKFAKLFKKQGGEVITISEDEFVKAKTEMKNRIQALLESMNQMGVQAVPLNTQELIELYYDVYNPDTAAAQPLTNYQNLEGEVVTKGQAPTQAGGVL